MAEVRLDPLAVSGAARDLAAVGRSSVSAIPSGQPWGSDEAGATFEAAYLPAASAALAAWSSVSASLGGLGDAVVASVTSTMDSDRAAAGRFRS